MTTMLSQPLSPVTLNNKGVLLLEAGKCEDAARCFKRASKMLMSAISHRQSLKSALPVSEHHDVTPPSQLAAPSATLEPLKESSTESLTESPKDKGIPQPVQNACEEPPRKRRRRSSLTSSFPVPTHYLGRPLWVQGKDKRQTPLDSSSLSATLLYNLGLSFNMIAVRKTQDEGRAVYTRALELYKMSSQIMLRGPMRVAIQSPVVLVALHNMIQVHKLMEEPEAAAKCQNELANVLRLMGTSSPEAAHYEEFYIKFLSLPKADGMAAAA